MNISSVNTTTGYTSEKAAGSESVKEVAVTPEASKSNYIIAGNEAGTAVAQAQQETFSKNIERVIESMKGPVTMVERSVHEGTKHIMYKIRNKETGEIIKEIPEEKLLDMAAKLIEQNGIVIDEKI
ncbi:flagellar protein FlaG [Paenibacillus algorifonticola]|uniref:Flagellar protein FlaG n=1 Tax=Paenibacillus algorifonticola TaxID=684063 RepID=A0A1I2IDH1_9BACL|nr:flagellar protein FlaG [Paenibacillus algorifonticola]SFF38581.1 flagellar protein FlaG [Paenibacillus algorifonticola]SFF46209.1 flagellar protein FlaG [Paenibacillus algorifonticola]